MEINEAGRRIVGEHWRLILLFLLAGLIGAYLLVGGSRSYTATARLVLNTPDPTDRASAIAIADTGNALATSPAEVTRALRAAHVSGRDGTTVAKHVSVRGLGTSGVLQLSVTDKVPRVATAVANALALRIIETRRNLSNGQLSRALARVNQQIEALDSRIIRVDAGAASLPAGHVRDAATRVSDALTQQRNVLESARVSLLSADAQRPQPRVISAALAPQKADASPRLPDTILGGLLGLVLGIALAGAIETIRPSVVGGNALAAEFDTPLIGTLSRSATANGADHELAPVAGRLRLAAEAANLDRIMLVAARPAVELERLAASIERVAQRPGEAIPAYAVAAPAAMAISPTVTAFSDDSQFTREATGLVLVLPSTMKKTELLEVGHLLRVTPYRLIGLITHPRPRHRARRRHNQAHATVGATHFESAS